MGSIPLAANNLRVPEQPNALEQYARIMQIKSAQQSQQMQGIHIQQAQKQQKDDEVVRQAFGANKGDIDKTLNDVAGKVSPQTYTALQQHAVDVKTKTADLVSKQGANAALQADLMVGAHDAVDKAPAEQKSAVYQQQLQALQQRGVDISQMPPQYPGDEPFKLIGAVVQGHKQQVEDALKQTEGAKNTAQATEAGARTGEVQANTAKIQAEMNFYKKQGLAPGVPLDAQEAADWMNKNPGKGPADFMKMKAGLVPQMNFNLQNSGATGTGGQPSAIAKGIADGSIKWNDAVSARTPMNVKQALLSEVKSINPAFKSSDFDVEKKVQENFTSGNYSQQLNSINRAREHMQTFLETAKDLDGGNVKAFNRLSNAFSVEFGSDKVGNLNIAKQAFSSEVGKAFAGASVGVTDRQELDHQINAASSFQQLSGAAKTADRLLAGAQKALKETYSSGMQGKPNFGNQSDGAPKMIQARDPQGKLHQAPAGTALPAGWKLEQ